MVYKLLSLIGGVFTAVGTLFVALTAYLTQVMDMTPHGNVYVDGVLVGENVEMSSAIFYIIGGVFLAIGVVILFFGIRGIRKRKKIQKCGKDTFGIITDIYHSNVEVNGRMQLKADVAFVDDDGAIRKSADEIGFDWNAYCPGDYVYIKQYNGDIRIIGKAMADKIAPQLKERLDAEASTVRKNFGWNDNSTNEYNIGAEVADVVTINGVEYVKKK